MQETYVLKKIQNPYMRFAATVKRLLSPLRRNGINHKPRIKQKYKDWLNSFILSVILIFAIIFAHILYLSRPLIAAGLCFFVFFANFWLSIAYFIIQGERIKLIHELKHEPTAEAINLYQEELQKAKASKSDNGDLRSFRNIKRQLKKTLAIYQGMAHLFPLRDIIIINIIQLPLFATFMQVFYKLCGPYSFDTKVPPSFLHWCAYAIENIFRSADLLDGLDIYRIYFEHIRPNSFLTGLPILIFRLLVGTLVLAAIKRRYEMRRIIIDAIASLEISFESSKKKLIRIGKLALPFLRKRFNEKIFDDLNAKHMVSKIGQLLFGIRVLIHFNDRDAMNIVRKAPLNALKYNIPLQMAVDVISILEEVENPDLTKLDDDLANWLNIKRLSASYKNPSYRGQAVRLAVRLLGRYGNSRFLYKVAAVLDSPLRDDQIIAVKTLLERLGKDSAELLIPYLKHFDVQVVLLVIEAVTRLRAEKAVNDLIILTNHPFWGVRSAAYLGLHHMIEAKELLKSPDYKNVLDSMVVLEDINLGKDEWGDSTDHFPPLPPLVVKKLEKKIKPLLEKALEDSNQSVILSILRSTNQRLNQRTGMNLWGMIERGEVDPGVLEDAITYCLNAEDDAFWFKIAKLTLSPNSHSSFVEVFAEKGIDRIYEASADWEPFKTKNAKLIGDPYYITKDGNNGISFINSLNLRQFLKEQENLAIETLSLDQTYVIALLEHLAQVPKITPELYKKHLCLSSLSEERVRYSIKILTGRPTFISTEHLVDHVLITEIPKEPELEILAFIGKIVLGCDTLFSRRVQQEQTSKRSDLLDIRRIPQLARVIVRWLSSPIQEFPSDQSCVTAFISMDREIQTELRNIVETSKEERHADWAMKAIVANSSSIPRDWLLRQARHHFNGVRMTLVSNLEMLALSPNELINILHKSAKDRDPDIRESATEQLAVALGKPDLLFGRDVESNAEPPLLRISDRRVKNIANRLLKDRSSEVRKEAITELYGFLDEKKQRKCLHLSLEDKNPDIRIRALNYINEGTNICPARLLASNLKDNNAEVREAAIEVVAHCLEILREGELSSDDAFEYGKKKRLSRLYRFLKKIFSSNNYNTYRRLAEKAINDSNAGVVIRALDCLDDEERSNTSNILPILIRILKSEPHVDSQASNWGNRYKAMEILTELPWEDIKTVILDLVDDPESGIRILALKTALKNNVSISFDRLKILLNMIDNPEELGSIIIDIPIEKQNKDQKDFLIELFNNTSQEAQYPAARHLTLFDFDSEMERNRLETVLREWTSGEAWEPSWTRACMIDKDDLRISIEFEDRREKVLTDLGRKLSPRRLHQLTHDPHPVMRAMALSALYEIGDLLNEEYESLLQDGELEVRRRIIRLPNARRWELIFETITNDNNTILFEAALKAIAEGVPIEHKHHLLDGLQVFIRIIQPQETKERELLLDLLSKALVAINMPFSIKMLVQLLSDRNHNVRASAVEALAILGDPSVITDLENILRIESDTFVQIAIENAIIKLKNNIPS